jgi:3-isopropylmalate/(R)-2-methylmalate dehydratase small subunit
VLPIQLPEYEVTALFHEVAAFPGYTVTIDLERQVVIKPDDKAIAFDIESFRKYCLLGGYDDVALTLRHADKIRAFEAERLLSKPWLGQRV